MSASPPIIALPRFILATRDAGYLGLPHALAELVDNAIQAGAKHIDVSLRKEPEGIEVRVQDDGCGMDAPTLAEALRFGGSSRFNNRTGLGRYGMGLPNSSLSHARRLDVWSWQGAAPLYSYLDVDEIAGQQQEVIPWPTQSALPPDAVTSRSGTLIRWSRCDRIDVRRLASLRQELSAFLSSTFRSFLWDGLQIRVDGTPLAGQDPLLLHPRSPIRGASAYGKLLSYPMRVGTADGGSLEGQVHIRFSELPVHSWNRLSNAEKRRMGITRGGGVYVVRGGRQLDHGWWFMGEKRRDNYDDWWRCEVAFDPVLDEAFGITHTKQQVRPSPELCELLTPVMEPIGRALNNRVRRAHQSLQSRARVAPSEARAASVEARLPPLPASPAPAPSLLDRLLSLYPDLRQKPEGSRTELRLLEDDLGGPRLFDIVHPPGRLFVVLNTGHPFYLKVYGPLAEDARPEMIVLRSQLELWVLALARAEAAGVVKGEAYRTAWGELLCELLKEQV